jgi:hypothetical protein
MFKNFLDLSGGGNGTTAAIGGGDTGCWYGPDGG